MSTKDFVVIKISLFTLEILGLFLIFQGVNELMNGSASGLFYFLQGLFLIVPCIYLVNAMYSIEDYRKNLVVIKDAYEKTLKELMEVQNRQILEIEQRATETDQEMLNIATNIPVNVLGDPHAIGSEEESAAKKTEDPKPHKTSNAIEQIKITE